MMSKQRLQTIQGHLIRAEAAQRITLAPFFNPYFDDPSLYQTLDEMLDDMNALFDEVLELRAQQQNT